MPNYFDQFDKLDVETVKKEKVEPNYFDQFDESVEVEPKEVNYFDQFDEGTTVGPSPIQQDKVPETSFNLGMGNFAKEPDQPIDMSIPSEFGETELEKGVPYDEVFPERKTLSQRDILLNDIADPFKENLVTSKPVVSKPVKTKQVYPDKGYNELVKVSAEKHGVPFHIAYKLFETESQFDPKARSRAGAEGIAQFMPATAKEQGVDSYDPESAIPGALKYLKKQHDKFGDWGHAVAAYNAGRSNVIKYKGVPPFKETEDYVKKVMGGYVPEKEEKVKDFKEVDSVFSGEEVEKEGMKVPKQELKLEQDEYNFVERIKNKFAIGTEQAIDSSANALKGVASYLEALSDKTLKTYDKKHRDVVLEAREKITGSKDVSDFNVLAEKINKFTEKTGQDIPILPERKGVEKFYDDVLTMVPQFVGQVGAHVVGGAPLGISYIGAQILGGKVEELEKEGVDPIRRFHAGLIDATAQAGLEAIGMGKALKVWKPTGSIIKVVKELGEVMGVEFVTEWFQKYPDAATTIWAKAKKDKQSPSEQVDQFIVDFWDTAKAGMYEGLVAMTLAGGVGATNIPASYKEAEQVKKKTKELKDIISKVDAAVEKIETDKKVSEDKSKTLINIEKGKVETPKETPKTEIKPLKDKEQQSFIDKKVKELGSLKAVEKHYSKESDVATYARTEAVEVYGGEITPFKVQPKEKVVIDKFAVIGKSVDPEGKVTPFKKEWLAKKDMKVAAQKAGLDVTGYKVFEQDSGWVFQRKKSKWDGKKEFPETPKKIVKVEVPKIEVTQIGKSGFKKGVVVPWKIESFAQKAAEKKGKNWKVVGNKEKGFTLQERSKVDVVAGKEKPAKKEPWEKTWRQYQWGNENLANAKAATVKKKHKEIVMKAVKKGKKVPQTVLNDYPDIKPKLQEETKWMKSEAKSTLPLKLTDPKKLSTITPVEAIPNVVMKKLKEDNVELDKIHRNEKVWKDTDFWLGKDNFWRYEYTKDYTDVSNKIEHPVDIKKIQEKGSGKYVKTMYGLKDVYDDKALFEKIPGLNEVKVRYNLQTAGSSFNPDTKIIEINQKVFDEKDLEFTKSFYHELQHAINNSLNAFPGASVVKAGVEGYKVTPGEMESRLIYQRQQMSLEEKAVEPPWVTLDKMLKEEGIDPAVGHTLYSGLDPVYAVKEIGKLLKDGKDITVELGQLGKKYYIGGKQKYFDWQKKMKTALGNLWEKIKGYIGKIWKSLKTPVTNQRGSVSSAPLKPLHDSLKRTAKLTDHYLGALSTRAHNIDPSVKNLLIEFELDSNTKIEKLIKITLPFIKATKKMSKQDYRAFDLARKNSDTKTIQLYLNKYEKQGLAKEYKEIRGLLDTLGEAAQNAGYKFNYRKDYHPRDVQDFKGLMDYLFKKGKLSTVELFIRAKEKRLERSLTKEERIELVHSLFRGYAEERITLSKPGQLKLRKLRTLDAEMDKYFGDSNSALLRYISDVTMAIEQKKLFGKGVNEKSELFNLDNTIGKYILDLVEQKKLPPSKELELRSILKARFSPVGTKGIVTTLKNLAVMDVMGSPASALRQVGDLGWSFIEAGQIATNKALLKAVVRQSRFTKEDLGISKIGAEFSDKTTSAKAVDRVFRLVWLTKIDAIGKETLINASYDIAQKRAKTTNMAKLLKFKEELEPIFGKERTDELVREFKRDGDSRDVRLYLLRKLSDYQPATLSEYPQGFIEGGNTRVAYMLKGFDLKKLDVYRRKVGQKLASKSPKTVAEGVKNLFQIAFWLTLMEATGDVLIDWFLGRPVDFGKAFKERLFSIAVGRYTQQRIKRVGVGRAIAEKVLPPTQFPDALSKDILSTGDKKGLELIKSIPVVGKWWYYRFGKGADRIKKNKRKKVGTSALRKVRKRKVKNVMRRAVRK